MYTLEGIILKRKSSGEADRIITIFSKQSGKIRVIARGIRRITSRRAGHVELFSHVAVTLHTHGSMDIITEAQSIRSGSLLEKNSQKVAYAYCMCELIDQLLADHQEHTEVFVLLSDALKQLELRDDSVQLQSIMTDFTHELLWSLGFLPDTRHIPRSSMQSYIERITERRLRAWPLMNDLA